MTDNYDSLFTADAMRDFSDSLSKGKEFKNISLNVDGDFNDPPPFHAVRLLNMMVSDMNSEETFEVREKVAKYCVKGKNVQFLEDGKSVGNMAVITDVNQNLGSDELLKANPIFYRLLLDLTTAYVTKKLTPPRKDTVPAKAGAESQGFEG